MTVSEVRQASVVGIDFPAAAFDCEALVGCSSSPVWVGFSMALSYLVKRNSRIPVAQLQENE